MGSAQQLRRYWHTVRHLRPSQALSRLDLRARAALRGVRPAAAARRYATRAARAGLDAEANPWQLREAIGRARSAMSPEAFGELEHGAREILDGTFTFLNHRASLGRPVDWAAADQSQLWRYHLHYFDYLPELVVAGADWPAIAGLMEEWVRRNPLAAPAARDGWHSYVVSLRLVNWMLALAAAPAGVDWSAAVVDSARQQTIFVARNLETDVGGNHLLKNLKALAIAGCFWRGAGADSLRERFVPAFAGELASQLRADGGHYEQSPMYHAQVLGDLVEVCLALRLSGRAVPEPLDLLAARMDTFLAEVCHPDGQIAQFGDSAFGMTPPPAALHAAVAVARGATPASGLVARHALMAAPFEPRTRASGADRAAPAPIPVTWDPSGSGFVRLATADRRLFLIADAGPVCPDDLPAHAHSDLFGFELSVDGIRMLVDSGVSEYKAGAWREYERSTRAHSTVVVDGQEQSDCWASFRVAERARVVEGRVLDAPGLRVFEARHDGYERLASPVRHTRRFALIDERFWLIVDELTGAAPHAWETCLHWHPEVLLTPEASGAWRATRGAAALGVVGFGLAAPRLVRGEVSPPQGWYAPEFGRRLPAATLVSRGAGPLPAAFGWLLVPHPSPGAVMRAHWEPDGAVSVFLGPARYELRRR